MIISMFNVVTQEISNSLKYVRFVGRIWTELRDRFAAIDGHELFQLEKDIHRIEQGSDYIEFYYHKLKGFWEEG